MFKNKTWNGWFGQIWGQKTCFLYYLQGFRNFNFFILFLPRGCYCACLGFEEVHLDCTRSMQYTGCCMCVANQMGMKHKFLKFQIVSCIIYLTWMIKFQWMDKPKTLKLSSMHMRCWLIHLNEGVVPHADTIINIEYASLGYCIWMWVYSSPSHLSTRDLGN